MKKKALVWFLGLVISPVVFGWEAMELENGHVRVTSSIAGIQGFSIIDTGSEMNAVNSAFLRANDLEYDRSDVKVRVGGVYSEDIRRSYRRIPVSLLGAEINFSDLVDLNLRDQELQMLLGAGFLRNFIFQFDYPNERMRALPRDALNMKKVKNLKSRRDPEGGSPLVQVKLDDRPVWLTLDTGNSSGIILERSIASQENWLEKYAATTSKGIGVVGRGEAVTFNLEKLEIGPFELGNPIVAVPPKGVVWNMFERRPTTGSNVRSARGKSRGLLGYDVLKHFVVTVDYRGGHVHIAPPE